jgi:GNAT superfamily N-acetyltransferase
MTTAARNTGNPTRIRDATLLDSEIIVQLLSELAEATGETVTLRPDYVKEFLAFPGSHKLLAEKDGANLGMLSYTIRPNLYHAENCCIVEEIVVTEKRRGKGVGKLLMEQLVKRASDAGCDEASLSVLPENSGAREFYRSLGFKEEAFLMELHFHPVG